MGEKHTMIRRALLDLDGVLLNFVKAAAIACGYKDEPYSNPKDMGVWNCWEVFGVTEHKLWQAIDFYEFWATLEWMPDGREILELVESYFGKPNIAIMTSPCQHPHCSAAKQWYIQEHLPDYRRRYLITSAKDFMADSGHVLIDDYDENVRLYRERGGPAILVPRPWNSLHSLKTVPALKGELERLFRNGK
jgi:5'(3')-deoxyribonucleotidase